MLRRRTSVVSQLATARSLYLLVACSRIRPCQVDSHPTYTDRGGSSGRDRVSSCRRCAFVSDADAKRGRMRGIGSLLV